MAIFTSNQRCLDDFASLLNDRSLSDVALLLGDGGKVFANKVILAARSPVFRAMLFGEMKESKQSEIMLHDPISEKDLLSFLSFIYSGSVKITQRNILPLLYLSRKYDVPDLMKRCKEDVLQNISISDATLVWDSAINMGEDEVALKCFELVSSNTKEALSSDHFPEVNLEIVLKIVSSPELTIQEIDLFQFIHTWIENQKRKPNPISDQDIQKIISYIRFPVISQEDLFKIVKPTQLISVENYLEALEFNIFPKEFDLSLDRFHLRKIPTKALPLSEKVLSTVFHTGNCYRGCMWDIVIKSKPITVTHLSLSFKPSADIYMHFGTHVGTEYNPSLWKKIASVLSPAETPLIKAQLDPPLELNANTIYGFYVHSAAGVYFKHIGEGVVHAEDDQMKIMSGKYLGDLFSNVGGKDVGWTRAVHYLV